MKLFGTELTIVSSVGWILVLHAANHVWAMQSVEKASGALRTLMVLSLVIAALLFAVAGLAIVGKIALASHVITALAVAGGVLSVLLIALTRNPELYHGFAANALFVAAVVMLPRLGAVFAR